MFIGYRNCFYAVVNTTDKNLLYISRGLANTIDFIAPFIVFQSGVSCGPPSAPKICFRFASGIFPTKLLRFIHRGTVLPILEDVDSSESGFDSWVRDEFFSEEIMFSSLSLGSTFDQFGPHLILL